MQTEVPTLPVVHLNVHKNLARKQNPDLTSTSVEVKPCSSCRNTACLSSNKKCLHPLLGGPYRSNVRQQPPSARSKLNKNSIEQRVLSAKMLRLKQLQNQLADAHYHLNELANENRLLKALQKRQDSALKRYEGANAELPRIINSHHEELRVLQIKYKKLKALHKETCDSLKEKESELQCLQSQNKHLVQLSKDRNLGEREKLQQQVSDLNHRIEQQQETIQMLHRKLTLESKSMKHQLHVEISKRKETQKNLDETVEKLRGLENLLDNRERRLYYSGQLPVNNKGGRLGTQSLTNLRDVSTSNPLKLSGRDKKWDKNSHKDSLPLLNALESNDDENVNKINYRTNSSQTPDSVKTETMASLQQVRKYRLQKSSNMRRTSFSLDDLQEKTKELTQSQKLVNFGKEQDEDVLSQREIGANEFRRIFENRRHTHFNESSNDLKADLEYSSEESGSEDDDEHFKSNYSIDPAKNSRELHTRLVNSANETSNAIEELMKKRDRHYSLQKEENLKELLAKELNNHEFKSRSRKDFYESNSESESELKKELNGGYVSERRESQMLVAQTENNEGLENKYLRNLQSLMDSTRSYYGEENDGSHLGSELQYNVEDYANDNRVQSDTNKSESSKESAFDQAIINRREITDATREEEEIQNESVLQVYHMETDNGSETFFRNHGRVQDSTIIEPHISLTRSERALDSQKSAAEKSQKTLSNLISANQNEGSNLSVFANNIETKNKLNRQEVSVELGSTDQQSEQSLATSSANEVGRARTINYNKEKLLATMKAIDDNENIEFLSQEYQKNSLLDRKQITENLYRGLPTQTRRKQDVIKDIFETDSIEGNPRSSYSKLH